MNKNVVRSSIVAATAVLLSWSSAVLAENVNLADIAAGDHRSAADIERNAWRHPVETLQFFGIEPDMRVVEIWPAGGWYTEILAPYLNANGTYVAAHWDPDSEIKFIAAGVGKYQAKLAERPDLYGNVEMTVLMPPARWDLGPAESADMVVTFRNIHNWMPRGYAEEMFAKIYEVLKPGGTLGVVEHRGNAEVPQDPKAASGYVNQAYAIAMAEAAGFKLVAAAEINANPKDTKDYESGVWTLPPTMRAGDDEKWRAIGESDRFTLKFVK